jgi:uncharacterized membrane protein
MRAYLTKIFLCLGLLLVNKFSYMHTCSYEINWCMPCKLRKWYVICVAVSYNVQLVHPSPFLTTAFFVTYLTCQGLAFHVALKYYIVNSFVMRFDMIACDMETKAKRIS